MRTVMLILVAFACLLVHDAPTPTREVDSRPFRLLSARKEAELRALLPRTEDATLASLLAQKDLILYTEAEMPRVFQMVGGAHLASKNISANATEPHGNANREFPWRHPAGTHKAKGVNSFKFVLLPGPIRWWRSRLQRSMPFRTGNQFINDEAVTQWEYPTGTVFGEVLQLSAPDGKPITFEVRTRKKRTWNWEFEVYRPLLTRQELCDQYDVKLSSSSGIPIRRLHNPHPGRTSFDVTAAVEELPKLPEGVVRKILASPFRSARGIPWVTAEQKDGSLVEGHAPTVKEGFSFIPPGYSGAFVEVSRRGCMMCHRDVGRQADEFDRPRDWYGRVGPGPGREEAIFSFHILDVGSLSRRGEARTPAVREDMVRAGLVKGR